MAKEKQAKFSIVLRENAFSERELEFIVHLTGAIVGEDGKKLRHFFTNKLSMSGMYLEFDAFKPGQTWKIPLRIPHHFVLLISGRDAAPKDPAKPGPGFVWGNG